jgi:hypothetical protein
LLDGITLAGKCGETQNEVTPEKMPGIANATPFVKTRAVGAAP